MTEEELHNFCKFLYSQVQSKDEEISRLTANIKELTDEVRLSRLQQQVYNNENMALGATHSQKLDVVLQQLQETKQELADTKRRLETAEALLADANEKNHQLEAERKKHAKERKDLVEEIALLRSDLYSGSKSQQSGRSAEEVGANDGRDDFDGMDASLLEENRKGDASSGSNTDDAKSEESENSQPEEPNGSSEGKDSDNATPETPSPPNTIYHGPSRKVRTYNKHTVGTPIIHKCDLSRLPEGVTYRIKKNPKKILHTITRVEERHNLDPLEYLCDVFRRIKTTAKDKLTDLLAHKWYPATAAVWELVELTFFLKDNKNLLILWLNGPKVMAYKELLRLQSLWRLEEF